MADYPDVIHDLLLGAYENLAQKLDEAGRKVAPGEKVEMKFDDATNSFTLVVNTVPA